MEQIDTDVQGMFSNGKYLLICTLNIVDGHERCVHLMANNGSIQVDGMERRGHLRGQM